MLNIQLDLNSDLFIQEVDFTDNIIRTSSYSERDPKYRFGYLISRPAIAYRLRKVATIGGACYEPRERRPTGPAEEGQNSTEQSGNDVKVGRYTENFVNGVLPINFGSDSIRSDGNVIIGDILV